LTVEKPHRLLQKAFKFTTAKKKAMSINDGFEKLTEALSKVQTPSNPPPPPSKQQSGNAESSTLRVTVLGLPKVSASRLIVKVIKVKDGTIASVYKDMSLFSVDGASLPVVIMGTHIGSPTGVYLGSATARSGGDLQLGMKNAAIQGGNQ